MKITIHTTVPQLGIGSDVLVYLNKLEVGERVIEAGQSCMLGIYGTIYLSKSDDVKCVRWELPEGSMGTTITWGTRRVTDVDITKDSEAKPE